MSESQVRSQLEAIILALGQFPQGASRKELEQALGWQRDMRTLQRYLSQLVAQGRLEMHGQKRGARYHLTSPVAEVESAECESAEDELKVSPIAQELRLAMRLPMFRRTPVGYRRAFLEDYVPNQSAYLLPVLREELATLGQTPDAQLPAGTWARQVFGRLLIDLSWNSSRLEGNTYSLLETERLLELGENLEGHDAAEARMILNHKAAIEMLVEDAGEIGFNRHTLLNLHALLSEDLMADPRMSGALRSRGVGIGGSVFHPLEGPQLISECFSLFLDKSRAIENPFEAAFFAMVHLPYLQAFEDGNKRVSRLAANIPFIRFNLCPLSFVGVPRRDYLEATLAVYELNRVELLREVFAWAYERSCQRYGALRATLGEPDPFRLRYRPLLRELVGEVVREAWDKARATQFLRAEAAYLPLADRARFLEEAETELQSLHEGNYVRYRVRPSQFQAWIDSWR